MAAKVGEAAAKGAAWPRSATIGDSLRASIVATDAAGLRAAWEAVKTSTHWRVVRMKNKFRAAAAEVEGASSGKGGLSSPNLHVNVVFGEDTDMPVLAEIQIHLQSVVDLKKSSHKLYQVTRADTAADARG